ALRAVLARLHAERRLFVEPRHRAVARVEHRIGDAASVAQAGFHRFHAVRFLVAARRDAERFLEAALQVKRARADRARELAERHALAAPRVEIGLCLADVSVHAATLPGGARCIYPLLAR